MGKAHKVQLRERIGKIHFSSPHTKNKTKMEKRKTIAHFSAPRLKRTALEIGFGLKAI